MIISHPFIKTSLVFCSLFISFSASAQKPNSTCDTTLWKHVVNPSRFKIINKCITVTGKIVAVEVKKDGDEHILLRLDAGEEHLLNEKNMKHQRGCLIVEIICANASARDDCKEACKGYTNKLVLPKTGNYISATGTYVQDMHHGWMEIHPVTSIVLIK